MEYDDYEENAKYIVVKGSGLIDQALAVCETVSLYQKVPFKKDILKKILQQQVSRSKPISIELIAGLFELLGLSSQMAEIETIYLSAVEGPIVLLINSIPTVLFAVKNKQAIIGCPFKGLTKVSVFELEKQLGQTVKFTSPKRVTATPTTRFGWNWFTPLLKKYKTALVLVFISSLLAQIFALAIPLLIQQIIDKVLSQGNLSSLNILGTAMIVMALFSGILNVLRTYIFVDTTDRMDLTLGSAVIDRLLGLPLTYFEKRPVGELSQSW